MTKPTDDELKEWGAVLRPFFDNPKDVEPDVKALARVLRRTNGPLGPMFLHLAELLDSQPGEEGRTRFAIKRKVDDDISDDNIRWVPRSNWRLEPVFVGERDKERLAEEREVKILEALDAEPNITTAIVGIDASGIMSARTAWATWKNMLTRRVLILWWRKRRKDEIEDERLEAFEAQWGFEALRKRLEALRRTY